MEAFNIQGTIELTGLNQATQGLQNLEKQATSSSRSLQSMGKTMVIGGAAITASLGMMVKSFVSTGSELHDLSTVTNIGAGRLAGYKYAAEQSSSSIGDFEIAIRHTSVAITEAKEKTGETTKAFELMGLKVEELEGLSPQEQFETIARAIAKIPDPIQRSAAAVAVFGRSGTSILPTLINQFEQTVQKGQELSGWTDDMANKADALGDAFGTLKTATEGLFNQIGSQLTPALEGLTGLLTDATTGFSNLAKQNPAITTFFTNLIAGAGSALTLFGGLTLGLTKLTGLFTKLGMGGGGGFLTSLGALTGVSMIGGGIMSLLSVKGATDAYQEAAAKLNELTKGMGDGSVKVADYNKQLSVTIQAYKDFLAVGESVNGLTQDQITRLTDEIKVMQEAYDINQKVIESQKGNADAIALTAEELEKLKKVTDAKNLSLMESVNYSIQLRQEYGGLVEATELYNIGLITQTEYLGVLNAAQNENSKAVRQSTENLIDYMGKLLTLQEIESRVGNGTASFEKRRRAILAAQDQMEAAKAGVPYIERPKGTEPWIGIQQYAEGGISFNPQLAMVSEHEPELHAPLSKLPSLFNGGSRSNGGNVTVNISPGIYSDRELVQTMQKLLYKMGVENVTLKFQ